MEKEASTEEKTTSSLSAEKLDRDAIAIQKEEGRTIKRYEISEYQQWWSQGDKLDNDPIHRDVCGKINDSRDFDYNAQERELDSNKGQKNLADKEPEPVFDGTEFPGMEAYRSMSIHSSDPDSETPGVVEKAVALTNLVKVKGVVAVSTFLRRLSGSRNEDVDGRDKAADAIDEPVQAIAMKGRIILYTRLGCQDCKDARLFLYWKKLRYTEINIDVYPSRKQELEKYSGSSAVPKVFFNEVLIGGLSELKGLDVSGKLDEKIDYWLMKHHHSKLLCHHFQDRFYKMRRFTKSFSGSEAVDFLSEDQYLEREEAIEFGRKLASKLFFQHVLEENLFEDGNHLYRFLDDDPIVSQCHNIPKAYVSEDGKHIDYRSIHGSEEFARYLRTVEELHRVELQDMRREERLAFFINLYNMMAIHAILVWGHPAGAIERRKLFGDFKYVIGGSTYSLSAIQNGILRGNQRPPYNLMKPFSPKDKRAMVALLTQSLLFILRCTWFLKKWRSYYRFDTKVASANKILKWFSIDFGKNEMEVLKHSSNYLEPAVSEALLELLATSQPKVMYQPYDWGLNC
ncbi:hypothetical protein M0R45_001327 [Rubus argutus]|uniref:DEP domain-containing protein n=1 Tax=Rubus argutus TaxID=59490 RepID=A0AAW1VMG9_RUBAR